MKTYLVSFCKPPSLVYKAVLRGPEGFDFQTAWRQFELEFDANIGPEPNVYLIGNSSWTLRRLEEIKRLQELYECQEDLPGIFLAMLTKHHNFQRVELEIVELW